MQAVMLAGGEGTRLRPISAECPKPMVRLFDKPVMEYGVELLRQHGFDRISVTLQTMPQAVTDYFGDGSAWDVQMRYNIEKEPLGTAGGVLAALEGTEETVLILSGDAVTDFDLRAALDYHKLKSADATLILTRRKDVLEYGLVMTGERGQIERFIEKPSWGQVFTDMVNTGIYILSPSALRLIPRDTKFDFARDLFPLMMSKGMALFGYEAEGYWCDVGDSGAFLQCSRDILDGQTQLKLPEQEPIPSGVTVTHPCYIGRGTRFGRDVRIGPHAALGTDSIVGDGVLIESSLADGAVFEAGSKCDGAYLGRGAVLRKGASVLEGAVIGAGAVIGEDAVVLEGARIWPRKEIGGGVRVSGSVSKGLSFRGAVFDGCGLVRGLPHVDVTPDYCYRLGLASAQFSKGETGLSWKGGETARLAALSLETGICAGGGRAVLTDAPTPACAAFTGAAHGIPLSIFIRQEGRILTLYFYDRQGIPPSRAEERRLESQILRGEMMFADPESLLPSRYLEQTAERYIAAASEPPQWAALGVTPISMTAGGNGEEADFLRRTLAAAGCVFKDGAILFSDGLSLSASLEDGQEVGHAHLLGALIHIEAAAGTKELALPPDAPAFLDDLGARQGLKILRLERDGETARKILADRPYTRDPIFMAARLAHGCRKLKASLSELCGQFPAFSLTHGEVPVTAERGAVMRQLARQFPKAEMGEGLCTRTRGGWVRIAPLSNRPALRIVAEGMNEELAEEILADFKGKIAGLDK
jgi:mannose-1-phosphate guanylyltransferase/phosphomannomutase